MKYCRQLLEYGQIRKVFMHMHIILVRACLRYDSFETVQNYHDRTWHGTALSQKRVFGKKSKNN